MVFSHFKNVYTCIQKQSCISFHFRAPENKILDYQTQQYKLFPGLTVAYCSFLAHKVLLVRYNTMLVEINNGSYKSLPEVLKCKMQNFCPIFIFCPFVEKFCSPDFKFTLFKYSLYIWYEKIYSSLF